MRNKTDTVAVITGATSGIGESIAKTLANEGILVILTGRNLKKLKSMRSSIGLNGKADCYYLDVTNSNDFINLCQKIVDTYGHIDILVNNAGTMMLSPVASVKIDEWDTMVDTNIKGTLNGVASVLPQMRKQKNGVIINICSTAGYRVMKNSSVYSATKFAIRAFSDGVRKEESNNGIKISIVSPGPTNTNIASHTEDKILKKEIQNTLKKGSLNPQDVADTVLFILSMPKTSSIDEIIISPTNKL